MLLVYLFIILFLLLVLYNFNVGKIMPCVAVCRLEEKEMKKLAEERRREKLEEKLARLNSQICCCRHCCFVQWEQHISLVLLLLLWIAVLS